MFDKKPKTPKSVKPGSTKNEDKKWLLWGLIGFTGILLITAVVLFFQLRKPVSAPPVPKARPKASPVTPEVKQVTGEGVCEVAFNIGPTPCSEECTSSTQCDTGLECLDVGNGMMCLNPSCTAEVDCVCPGITPSPSPSPPGAPMDIPSPSPRVEQPQLPEAGVSAPAVLGVSAGLLLVVFGLLF